MNRISPEEAREEVVGSLRDLEREIGSVLPIFAYPSGGFNDAVVRVLEQAGVKLAFTTRRGINDLCRPDPLRLRRINVGQRTTLAALRAQLLPWLRYIS
jgi:peptidoglycan/xylan/chitin deacetylase (PgdA/CDA1 family)